MIALIPTILRHAHANKIEIIFQELKQIVCRGVVFFLRRLFSCGTIIVIQAVGVQNTKEFGD